MTTRLGLIGYGAWGRRIASTIEAMPEVALVAIARSSVKTADVDGVPVWSDWQHMIENVALDGVIVATPPDATAEIAAVCIERRLPAYLEKPICLCAKDATALLCQSVERKCLLVAGHLHLYAPAFVALRKEVEASGRIFSIYSEGGNAGPFRTTFRALFDYGPHDIAMVLALLNGEMPNQTHASRTLGEPGSMSENVEMHLSFKDVRVEICCGNLFPEKRRCLTVKTDRGEFVYNDLIPKKLTNWTGSDAWAIPYDDTPPLLVSLRRFTDMVQDGVTVDPDFSQAVSGIRVLENVVTILNSHSDAERI